MANFQWERLVMALGSVAGMQACLDRTLLFACEREAFGRPIGRFQAIRHKVAEMATTIEAGRALTYHALRLFVDGHDAVREVTRLSRSTHCSAIWASFWPRSCAISLSRRTCPRVFSSRWSEGRVLSVRAARESAGMPSR